MDGAVLEATQLSSLSLASRLTYRYVDTTRRNIPLPPSPEDKDAPIEHAIYSTVLHSSWTGPILLRVLNDRVSIELVSLTLDIPPIRFVFPATIASAPGIFLWEAETLHVIAVTKVGALFHLIIPAYDDELLWDVDFQANWYREHHIHSAGGSIEGLVHVHGPHTVVIALANGDLLRMEADTRAEESGEDHWSETIFHHGSFLSSLTSYIPTLSSNPANAAQIVSAASYPYPTDIGWIWTLSRDRTLRLWTATAGCTSTKVISSATQGRSSTPMSESSPSPSKSSSLLEAEPRNLLRVFTLGDDMDIIFVLAFVPTPASTSSGGTFHVFKTEDDQLQPLSPISCSSASVHCHLQDFVVVGYTLYTLWDRQGRSYVEWYELAESAQSLEVDDVHWKTASYAREVELTPAYLDELLYSHGSLTDKCFEAVMRPGMFSMLTLKTALRQYSDACLSLPGTPPPQLQTSYATLGENIAAVVGCTVNLTRDAQTGALQYDKYWAALRRDWEGFIARCREIERSARWPLAMGVDRSGGIVFVERERAGSVVREDAALTRQRMLSSSLPLEPQYLILDVAWTLRTHLSPETLRNAEDRLTEIQQLESNFSYLDVIVQDNLDIVVDEGLDSWIKARLLGQGKHLESLFRQSLDIVTQRQSIVKREEEEVELAVSLEQGLRQSRSVWQRSLAASYVTDTVNARYELCLALLIILWYLRDNLRDDHADVVDELLVAFRGLAMLRHVVRQPAGELRGTRGTAADGSADEMIARMHNMRMTENVDGFAPVYSLVDRLLANSGDSFELPRSAHKFLGDSGLLDASSMTVTSAGEARFCDRLRELGYSQFALDLMAWLPRSSPLTYVRAKLWLTIGRFDDAARLFESLAGSYEGLPEEDCGRVDVVAPAGALISQYNFYLHVAGLFRAAHVTSCEIAFSQLAISVAPPSTDLQELWYTIIKGYTDLAQYEDAYSALISTPYEKLKRDCVSDLVFRMCEDYAVEKLMTFNFAAFADEVEGALSFKARNGDPMTRPFYSSILHTWFIRRGDYRNAALTMYQRGRRLAEHPAYWNDLPRQLEAYLTAMNALSLVDPKNAWFVMPVVSDSDDEPWKRRRLSKHIPEDKYAVGKRDSEIVELADIRYDYALLSARLELMRLDPEAGSVTDHLLSPSSIVMRLAQANRFITAMSLARSLHVDMSDLFSLVTRQCLRLSYDPDMVIQEDTSDWLLTDNVKSWSGTPAERAWRYVRESIQRHDSHETDFKYSKVVFETILDRESMPPPWLVGILEENHHEWLIRTCLRYETFELMLQYTLSFIRKNDASLPQNTPKNAMATWLPYNLIDQVLEVCESQPDVSSDARSLHKMVRDELATRLHRLGTMSQNAQSP
ncbi:hypothetical protein NEOLEDRAFT_1111428 [Neolentinus lepideus HHB14362 ss-1]|uniref:Nucleoporin Nup120/160-domain-containing protein n=1 Tax=Neolentinus lepideus HHB14362 ss-1 TaxID=1314782 RepID=A0A165TMR5_9AGAM|nr:hypothetical protein NEOLEDRAFT_1111428 [Neolentinus lepideus HHB14362 ss-1]